jgi:hypothetical protein
MGLADNIDLALIDAFLATGTTFKWQGQDYGCVLNADQNVLVTSKRLFGANLPKAGDVINLAGKDRQITGRANSAEEFVPGGLSAENTFVDDPANPSLAIQFSSFIGT